jgi:site-specific recombinase XerD
VEVDRFAARYADRRSVDLGTTKASARSAIRAWAWGLATSGVVVPAWLVAPKPPTGPPILAAYAEHRRDRNGVAASTVLREVNSLRDFFQFLRARGRRVVARIHLVDVDAYVVKLRERLSRRTVAGSCGAIRAYLRFLYVTRRLRHDLAASVAAPRWRAWERPPRALPWDDVKAILRSVDRSTRTGRRDYALLLTMAAYGLGAAEACTLELGDVDWSGGRIRVRRPKTGQQIVLPLLADVARALLAYLRHGRPSTALRKFGAVAARPVAAPFVPDASPEQPL